MGELLDWLTYRREKIERLRDEAKARHPDGHLLIRPGRPPSEGDAGDEPNLLGTFDSLDDAFAAAEDQGDLCWLVSIRTGEKQECWANR